MAKQPYELVDDEELYLYLLVYEMLERQYKKLKKNPQEVFSDAFWATEAGIAFNTVIPQIADYAVNGAQLSLAGNELVFVEDVSVLFENVRIAAQQQGAQLIRNINATTQNAVIDLLDKSIAEGWDINQLTEALTNFPSSPFGEQRARLIAVSETTDAYMRGAELAGEELRNNGYEVTYYWETALDSLVCNICGPRQGRAQGDGWDKLEKAHPGCRCDIRIETVKL